MKAARSPLPRTCRLVTVTMADTPNIESRLRAILDNRVPRSVVRGAVCGAITGAALASIVMAALRPAPAVPPPPASGVSQEQLAQIEAQLRDLEAQLQAMKQPEQQARALSTEEAAEQERRRRVLEAEQVADAERAALETAKRAQDEGQRVAMDQARAIADQSRAAAERDSAADQRRSLVEQAEQKKRLAREIDEATVLLQKLARERSGQVQQLNRMREERDRAGIEATNRRKIEDQIAALEATLEMTEARLAVAREQWLVNMRRQAGLQNSGIEGTVRR